MIHGSVQKWRKSMSKKYPECPLYNHNNCKELHNPKLCALVKENKECIKKLHKNAKLQKPVSA